MHVVAVVIESVGMILGTLALALMYCAVLWWAFSRLGHPAWGAPLTLLLIPLIFLVPGSPFLDLTVTFAVLLAIPFWFEGRAWRLRHATPDPVLSRR